MFVDVKGNKFLKVDIKDLNLKSVYIDFCVFFVIKKKKML